MISPEKADVNVSRLFNWSGEFTFTDAFGKQIADQGKPVTVFIRLVGDADINRARVFAIRKSADLRKQLKNKDSDFYVAFISTVYEVEDISEICTRLGMLKIRDISDEVLKELKFPLPKEPKSEATLEELEKFQELVDTYETRRLEAVNEEILKRVLIYQETLKSNSLEALQSEYERQMILNLCEEEMVTKFREYCIFLGCYKDPAYKEKFFTSFDEFDNLPSEVKEQFSRNYSALELGVDELKKLLGVTQ